MNLILKLIKRKEEKVITTHELGKQILKSGEITFPVYTNSRCHELRKLKGLKTNIDKQL